MKTKVPSHEFASRHTISVKKKRNGIPVVEEIIADSLEDALAYIKTIEDNPTIGYILFDQFKRIVKSRIGEEKREYKHNEGHEHQHGEGHHHHGHGHGHGHDDDDDSYA